MVKTVVILFLLITIKYSEELTVQKNKLQRVLAFKSCYSDLDCKENSFCYDNDSNRAGNCKCLDGFMMMHQNQTFYACYTPLKYHDECTLNEECYADLGDLGVCDTRCKCKSGYHYYPEQGQCFKTVPLEGSCHHNGNCLLRNQEFAFCVVGKCECPYLKTPSSSKDSCVFARKINETCSSDDECFTANSRCRTICECVSYYTMGSKGDSCLRAATEFGGNCSEESQCSQYLEKSICLDGTCGCNEGLHGYGNKCLPDVREGESCSFKGECVLNDSLENLVDCTEGVCTCLSDDCLNTATNHQIIYSNLFILIFLTTIILN